MPWISVSGRMGSNTNTFQLQVPPAIWKQNAPMKSFISQSGVTQRSNYVKTHLANWCTKQIKIRHRCLQTQLNTQSLMLRYKHNSKPGQLDTEMPSVVPGKECGGTKCRSGCTLQTTTRCCFHFSPFFSVKVKILFGCFSQWNQVLMQVFSKSKAI